MVSDTAFGTRAEVPASAACSPSGSTRGGHGSDDSGSPGKTRDDIRRALSPSASRAAVDDVDARLASFTLRAMEAFDARLAETQREAPPDKPRGDRACPDPPRPNLASNRASSSEPSDPADG